MLSHFPCSLCCIKGKSYLLWQEQSDGLGKLSLLLAHTDLMPLGRAQLKHHQVQDRLTDQHAYMCVCVHQCEHMYMVLLLSYNLVSASGSSPSSGATSRR